MMRLHEFNSIFRRVLCRIGSQADKNVFRRGRPFGFTQGRLTRSPRRPLPTHSISGVRAFAIFGNETVDPRRDNGQRYRAELEHRIVESADVQFY